MGSTSLYAPTHPVRLLVLHNVGEHRAAQVNHMLATRWVLNPHLDLSELLLVAFRDVFEVESAHLFLQPRGEPCKRGGA